MQKKYFDFFFLKISQINLPSKFSKPLYITQISSSVQKLFLTSSWEIFRYHFSIFLRNWLMEICRLIFRWFAPPCKRVGFAPTQGWTYCRVRLPTAGYHVSILGVTLHRVGTPDLQLLRQNFWPQIFRQNPWLFTSSWLCWQEPVATMIKSMTSNNPLQV